MKAHNIGFETITEALSKKRRRYDAASPLRSSSILDARELFILVKKTSQDRTETGQGTSHYPAFVFKSLEKAQKFLEDVGAEDHQVVSVYDKLRIY